jgi:hypothetical protein
MYRNQAGPDKLFAAFRKQFPTKLSSFIKAPPHVFLETGWTAADH